MNILVVSDTHGNIKAAAEMAEKLGGRDAFELIIHCGDHCGDAAALERRLGIPSAAVRGNCDGARKGDFRVVETPGARILVTHGHAEDVDYGVSKLVYKAKELGCRAVCFGHTHVSLCEEVDGVRLLNPGSPTRPRMGSGRSVGVISSTEDGFAASVVMIR